MTGSISAHDWVHRSTVDPAITDRWPEYQAVLIAWDRLDAARLASVADELWPEAMDVARLEDDSDHIARWHETYRSFGVKPRDGRVSVDALRRRAVSERGLPRISPLVDVYNAVSILHCVPIGGEDLDAYVGPARLGVAVGDEPFLTTDNGSHVVDHPSPGEPVWVDDAGVTCRRWNWRQTTRTAIGAHTGRVGLIIDSMGAVGHAAAAAAADRLAAVLGATEHRRVIG